MNMTNLPVAKTATDQEGNKIKVGDTIRFRCGPLVTVTAMHRQGADGTILTTDPAPDPEYRSHFSCRASDCVKR